MQNVDLTNIVLALFVLYAVLRRQLEPRLIKLNLTTYVFLILFGAASVADAFNHHQITLTSGTKWFVLGALVSAGLFGWLRTLSYRLWVNDDGLVMRQGNWLTVILWIVGIALHLLSDRAWQGSDATLMLYLGLTLLIQRGLVWLRARRQFPEATQQTAAYHEAHHRERHHSRQR